MPWTFAHPAAVLPLRAFPRLPFGALVVGSLSPDIGYYVGAFPLAVAAHTLPGIIFICLPSSIALMVILRMFHKPVAELFPYPHRQAVLRLPSFRWPVSVQNAGFVCLAIAIGAATHVAWDAFTHPSGYFVARMPALRAILFTLHGRDYFRFQVMQHVSTLLGASVLLMLYRRVSRRAALESTGPRESDTWRYILLGTCAAISIAASAPAAYFTATDEYGRSGTLLVVRFVIVCTTMFAVLLAAAGVVHVLRRQASGEGKAAK